MPCSSVPLWDTYRSYRANKDEIAGATAELMALSDSCISASLTVVSEDSVSVLPTIVATYSAYSYLILQQSCGLLVLDQTFLSPIGTLGALRRGCMSLLHSRDFPTRQK